MPVYNTNLSHIDLNETRRYAGLRNSDFPIELLQDACLEAQLLSKPSGVWQLYDYNATTSTIITDNSFVIVGEKIRTYLQKADKIAVMAVSIGDLLETTVSQQFDRGNYTYALLLDAAGTTAVEMVANQLSNAIQQQANKLGYLTLNRFSPGYGDWDIQTQPDIVALADGARAGISVTESCMLIPRKSVTAVIGLIPNQLTTQTPEQSIRCSCCSQKNCLARKEESE